MMSLAAPVASAVPARVQRRARPHAVASARATSLGAGWAHGGSSARALKARARVTAPRRVMAAPAQAKTLEERIASGEFTQSTESPLLWGLNNLRDAIKNVAPQSTCALSCDAPGDETARPGGTNDVSIAFSRSGYRARCARPPRIALFTAPRATRVFGASRSPPTRRRSRAPR
jgi:hypothetical protein